jgi:hypothetical protein
MIRQPVGYKKPRGPGAFQPSVLGGEPDIASEMRPCMSQMCHKQKSRARRPWFFV